MSNIEKFKSLLDSGNDNALLRYSLGNEYYKAGYFVKAIVHLKKATELKNDYSAAWKLYGKALTENNQETEAIEAYKQGIAVAEKNGDMQAVKEMSIFLKRLENKKE